jgi:rabenosyn-5
MSSDPPAKAGRVFGSGSTAPVTIAAGKFLGPGSALTGPSLGGNTSSTTILAGTSPKSPKSIDLSSPRKGTSPRLTSPTRVDSPASSELSVGTASSTTSLDETSSTGLSCPICQESMVTLLQLNRHLDDVHSEKSVENEQLKSWFKKKVERARQIHSVNTVLQHSGLGKLDLFEDSAGEATPSHDGQNSYQNNHQTGISQGLSAQQQAFKTTDDSISRKHWQKASGRDSCSDPICDKILNARNGSINCRHCGKLFCNEHTKYQMKLSKNAKHSPQKGIWCRVCETCYKTRRGYSDSSGTLRDRTEEYFAFRQPHIDIKELEVNKLEKRAITLVKELATYGNESGLLSYGRLQKRRSIERQVAVWEDEAQVEFCRICQEKFGYLLRKHHCRICGLVVCADLSRDCSRDVQLSIIAGLLETDREKLPRNSNVSVRMCLDCKQKIFMKRNFERDLNQPPSQLLRLFDTFSRVKNSIELNLPKFQVLLSTLNDPEFPPPHTTIEEASAVRKKLLDSFVQCDTLSRKILSYSVSSETEKRLQKQIYGVATQYLQERMLPLRTLPRALKHAKNPQQVHHHTSSSLSEVSSVSDPTPTAKLSNTSSPSSAVPTEQIIVLEEQKFLLSRMIQEAKAKRRFDELGPLEASWNDLDQEIQRLSGD